jgi:putative MATE family efflux protein
MVTVILNMVLSPILIAGWFTGRPLGVIGAGLGSSIAIGVGVLCMGLYFVRLEKYVTFERQLFLPRLGTWGRILKIGLPPGGEFALFFVYVSVVYLVLRDFGAGAQAGVGIGSRIMQAIFLPAMAVAFATAPVAGQNFGAGQLDRVRETFRTAALLGTVVMAALTLLCQYRPEALVRGFSSDPMVVQTGSQFLQINSLNFVTSGLIFTCSGMFQALGNTLPGVLSTASRLVTFVLPAFWLSKQPGFELHHIWILSVVTVALQALTSLWFLRREFRRRLVG